MSQSTGQWHTAARADQVAPDSIVQRSVAGRKLVIGRTQEGYFAVDDLCPHAGASLGLGTLDGNSLICPLHGWEFDVFSGKCAAFGVTAVSLPIRVTDGVIEVQW